MVENLRFIRKPLEAQKGRRKGQVHQGHKTTTEGAALHYDLEHPRLV